MCEKLTTLHNLLIYFKKEINNNNLFFKKISFRICRPISYECMLSKNLYFTMYYSDADKMWWDIWQSCHCKVSTECATKNLLKSADIWRRQGQKFGGMFLRLTAYWRLTTERQLSLLLLLTSRCAADTWRWKIVTAAATATESNQFCL